MTQNAVQSGGILGSSTSGVDTHNINGSQQNIFGATLIKKSMRVACSAVISVALLCLVNVSQVFAQDETTFSLTTFGQSFSTNDFVRPAYSQGGGDPESSDEVAPSNACCRRGTIY